MQILAAVGSHWPLFVAALVVVAFCVLLPTPALAVGRWLIGTERGHYVLALLAITGGWWWYRSSLLEQGARECRAEADRLTQATQVAVAKAQTKGAIAALDAYMAGAQAMADIGAQQEKDHAAALRAKENLIACLRDGSCQLRDHWACAVPAGGAADAGAGRDGDAERRIEDAGRLIEIADTADADLRACQATVTDYRKRGVLRPPQ